MIPGWIRDFIYQFYWVKTTPSVDVSNQCRPGAWWVYDTVGLHIRRLRSGKKRRVKKYCEHPLH